MKAENEALKARVASLEKRFAKLEGQHAAGQD
jgi:BMFP domain-containing protein YqiC